MALRLNDIEAAFRLKADEGLKALDAIVEKSQRADKQLKSLTDTAQKVGLGFAAVGAAITTAFAFAIRGAAEETESLAVLGGAVNAAGGNFEKQRPAIESFIDGLARTTKFTDDQLRPALARAIAATNDVDKGMRAAELGARLAAAGLGSLEQNGVLVARLFDGQARAVARLIPEFRDLNDRLDQGASEADIAAEALGRLNQIAANAPSPQPIQQLTKAVGELGDTAGTAALQALDPLIKGLTSLIEVTTEFGKTAAGKAVIDLTLLAGGLLTAAGAVLLLVKPVIEGVVFLKNFLAASTGAAAGAQALGAALTGPIGIALLLGAAIAGLVIHLSNLSKASDEARDKAFSTTRIKQFTDEIESLQSAIAGLEQGTLSAGKAQEVFNRFGVADLDQARQRVTVLGQIVQRLKDEKKATEDAAAARLASQDTKEKLTAAQGVGEARLQAASDRVKAAAALGQIDAAAAAQQEAVIEKTRTALRISTLDKLLALEVAAGDREVAAGAKTAAANAAQLAPLRANLLAEQIKASTAGLAAESEIVNARLNVEKTANDKFLALVLARQQVDEADAKGRVALGTETEAQLTELLIGQLNERTNLQHADIAQRLTTLKEAGLEETQQFGDLQAELIRIDLGAETQRSALETQAHQQGLAKERQDATTSRELRRVTLVTGEADLQKARLAEVELSFEDELAKWQALLDQKLINQNDFDEASVALEKARAANAAQAALETNQLESSILASSAQAIDGLATLSANFAVDFLAGIDSAGEAATKFFHQLVSDLTRAIAKALILQAIIGAVGKGSFLGKALGKLFQDPTADQMARFEGQRFVDLFFQGVTRQMGNARDRIGSALTDNRQLVENRGRPISVLVNEATPETTVEFTDRKVEPRVRERARQRTGVVFDAVGNPA